MGHDREYQGQVSVVAPDHRSSSLGKRALTDRIVRHIAAEATPAPAVPPVHRALADVLSVTVHREVASEAPVQEPSAGAAHGAEHGAAHGAEHGEGGALGGGDGAVSRDVGLGPTGAALLGAATGAGHGSIGAAVTGVIQRQTAPGTGHGHRRHHGAAAAHPVAVASTVVRSPLSYGSVYTHTLTSSTGRVADIAGIVVGERVTVSRDDFGLGWSGVPLGTITAPITGAGEIDDRIGTPASAIHARMPSVGSLPAILDTPQTLHWRDAHGAWHQFASIAIRFEVRRNSAGALQAVTTDNGVAFPQPYTGPAPSGGGGSGGSSGGSSGGHGHGHSGGGH